MRVSLESHDPDHKRTQQILEELSALGAEGMVHAGMVRIVCAQWLPFEWDELSELVSELVGPDQRPL